MTESVTSDPKAHARDQLRTWRETYRERDQLVRAAKQVGCTWDEIESDSGLSSKTINRILSAAGLTGKQPDPQENPPMPPTVNSAKYYPHHPHFIGATKEGFGVKYTFRAFTGTEPEPQRPERTEGIYERPDNDEQRIEYLQRLDEIDAMWQRWRVAKFTRDITPHLKDAPAAWNAYLAAREQLDQAWAALDNPPHSYPVSIKAVLDAQQKLRDAAATWEYDHAEPIARVQSTVSETIMEKGAYWTEAATTLGISTDGWQIGSIWSNSYSPAVFNAVNTLIDNQLRRLKEVAALSGTRFEQ